MQRRMLIPFASMVSWQPPTYVGPTCDSQAYLDTHEFMISCSEHAVRNIMCKIQIFYDKFFRFTSLIQLSASETSPKWILTYNNNNNNNKLFIQRQIRRCRGARSIRPRRLTRLYRCTVKKKSFESRFKYMNWLTRLYIDWQNISNLRCSDMHEKCA